MSWNFVNHENFVKFKFGDLTFICRSYIIFAFLIDNSGFEGSPSQAVIGTKVIPITVLAGFDLTNFSLLKNKKIRLTSGKHCAITGKEGKDYQSFPTE